MNLKISDLYKYYDKKILDGISLELSDVNVLALIGPSGSGKSTLLRLIAGLEGFQQGDIKVNGFSVAGGNLEDYRKKVGFVFQDHNLFDHLTVIENILLVLEKVHHRDRNEALEEVTALLDQFGLLEHKDKYPHQISGGQSQRVSIVRALAIQPDMILLDEPTSSLDPVLTFDVLLAIKKLIEQKKNVILVTHEIGFAKEIADYTLYLEEGVVVEQGDESIFEEPKTEALQAFLQKVLSFHDS